MATLAEFVGMRRNSRVSALTWESVRGSLDRRIFLNAIAETMKQAIVVRWNKTAEFRKTENSMKLRPGVMPLFSQAEYKDSRESPRNQSSQKNESK
jgi:hypothetical protein